MGSILSWEEALPYPIFMELLKGQNLFQQGCRLEQMWVEFGLSSPKAQSLASEGKNVI
jgi:hypothetical protein